MKLTSSSLDRKQTQISSAPTPTKTMKGTNTRWSITEYQRLELKELQENLYDSDQSPLGDILYRILNNLERVS